MKTPFSAGVLGCCLTAAAFAQQSPAPAPASGSDEIITLSEFNVSGDRASGYRAQNSITATGFGANILDVPVTINVLTGEFVQDINASLQSEALRYIPGVITNPNYESYINIRGFSGLQSYRNGQYRRQLYSTWNMDRVELIKGSSSIFFGLVRPGGVVNYITKKPKFNDRSGDASVTFGSWDFKKAELNYNVGGDKLAARFGAGGIDAGGWRENDFKQEHFLGGSVAWQVFPSGRITLDLETVRRVNQDRESAAIPRSNSRYLFNSAVPAGQAPRAWLDANGFRNDPTFNIYAPVWGADDPYGREKTWGSGTYSFYQSYTADLDYVQKIGDHFVYQMQWNFAIDDFEILRSIGGDNEPFADGTVRFRFGNFANYRDSYNFDNKLVYRFTLGDSKHTVQLGQELQRVHQDTPGWQPPAGGAFQDGRYGAFAVWNPRTQPLRNAPAERAASAETWNINRRRVERVEGYFLGLQSSFFGDRLHALVGARQNQYLRHTYYERSVTNPEGRTPEAKKTTPQYGFLYKFTPHFSGFAMYSESLEPQLGADADGRGLDPVDGTGWDIGVKAELLNGRFAGTLAFYGVEREGMSARDSAREVATARQPWFIYGNAEESQGIEVDFSYNPLESWQVMFGYSHALKAEVTASTVAARVGLPLQAFPDDVLSIWTKYDIRRGSLNGWSFGGGLRYSSDSAFASDQNVTMRMDDYTTVDLLAQYRFKLGGRDSVVQLNVKNLFDGEYREGNFGGFGDPRNFMVSLRTRF